MSLLLGEILFATAAATLAVCGALVMRWHRRREFHDAMPPLLRLGRSVSELLLPHSLPWTTRPAAQPLLAALDRDLRLAGLAPQLRAPEWIASALGTTVLAASLTLLACLLAQAVGLAPRSFATTLIVSICAALLTQRWLRQCANLREAALLRELPAGLELLALSLECGCALPLALEISSRHLPAGALRQILRSLHADLSAGRSRGAALRRLFDLHQGSVIAPTLGALVQADASGSSLAPVLRAQARQRSEERFAAAEKAALQAPVKMLLPLISCIFPCTFIVIAFPLVTRFLQ